MIVIDSSRRSAFERRDDGDFPDFRCSVTSEPRLKMLRLALAGGSAFLRPVCAFFQERK
jgi:hypothetical protein